MAKVKFSLNANPTFKSKVEIPVPGDKSATVEFVFKGRTRTAFKDFIDGLKDRDLEDAFDKDNVEVLTQNSLGAARAIIEKYLAELTSARLGN